MPYIKNNLREELEPELNALINKINTIYQKNPENTRDGLLNYSFTKVVHNVYPKNRYHELNELMGMLECMKQEVYRQRVGPYEDEKIVENGDVIAPYNSTEKEKGTY